MKTFSIMETQHNLARVLRVVEAGEQVGVTRRKKLVARIIPVRAPVELPDFEERARRVWDGEWKGEPSDELLREARGGR